MTIDTPFLPGLLLVAVVTTVVVVVLLLVGVSRPGPRRAGLVAGGLPLALLPTMAAAAYVSVKLTGLFSEAAAGGNGAGGGMRDACTALEALLQLAWTGFAGACVLGFVLGVLRSGRSTSDAACSAHRAAVLMLLPILGLVVAAVLTREVRTAVRITAAMASSHQGGPQAREAADAALEAAGFSMASSGSLGAVARYLARTTMLGTFGGITAVVVLLGLALPGFVLAWQVRFGGAFLAFASVAWLVAAGLGGLVGLGVL